MIETAGRIHGLLDVRSQNSAAAASWGWFFVFVFFLSLHFLLLDRNSIKFIFNLLQKRRGAYDTVDRKKPEFV